MGEFSPIHWLIVLAIIVLLFGGKKIPEVMKGLGEGIRHFKDGMSGNAQTSTQPTNPNPPAAPVVPPAPAATEEKK
jgi:sec-independent protein translocase protein TatA